MSQTLYKQQLSAQSARISQLLGSRDVLVPDDKNWPQNLKNYRVEKTAYNFSNKDFPGHISHKIEKDQECSFNPITQKYLDPKLENATTNYDYKENINNISKGFDYEVNLESTYNVINLRSKLKGLNYSEDKLNNFRRQKKNYPNNVENRYLKPYNILSNNSFQQQHYLPPEQRKSLPSEKDSNEGLMFRPKNKLIDSKFDKDFNIITNKYKIFNDEKAKAEKEIQNLKAAKKIQNLKSYDIIKGQFINSQIENEYRKANEAKQMSKINNAIRDKLKNKNYIIINPINNEVYDKEEQKKLDEKDKIKLDQFRMKAKIDNFYRALDTNNEINNELKIKNSIHPNQSKIIEGRGYNILNNASFNEYNVTKTEPNTSFDLQKNDSRFKYKYLSDWEKIKFMADGRTRTIDKKPIYKSPYDKTDVNENYQKFLAKRKNKLRDLSPFEKDELFKINVENELKKNNSNSVSKSSDLRSKNLGAKTATIQSETNKKRGRNVLFKFDYDVYKPVCKKEFFGKNKNVLDFENRKPHPVLIDKNVNTRNFNCTVPTK